MVADLALLIDEQNLGVRGVGVNPQFEEAQHIVDSSPADAWALLQRGRDQIGQWLVDNASSVVCPVVVYGKPADVLYQALAGHSYGHKPAHYAESQLVQIARYARAFIESQRGGQHDCSETWRFVWQVVQAAGGEIRPWLCTLLVDVDGRPLESSPLYDVRLRL